MEKKASTFSCIDHSAPKGELKMNLDIATITQAISKLEYAIREIQHRKPEIVHVAPVVHVPESPVTVNLPEMSPRVEVHPSEIVIQRQDGVMSDIKPQVIVQIPTKGIALVLGLIPLIMLIELTLKLF